MKPMRTGIGYADSGGVAIAYEVVGAGDSDLVYVPDYVSNLVYAWETPYWPPFYERLAQSFRLILFDKRGTGLSDHGPHFAALETRMEDLRAVLDAAGSERAVVLGAHEGCGMAALYAATYPERTRALVLFHPAAQGVGRDGDEDRRELGDLRAHWGEEEWCADLLRGGCPTLYAHEDDPALVRELVTGRREPVGCLRASTAPSSTPIYAKCSRRFASRRSSSIAGRRGTRRRRRSRSRSWMRDAQAMRVSGQRLFRDLPLARRRRRDRALRRRRDAPSGPGERLDDGPVHRSRRLDRACERGRRQRVARPLAEHHALVRRELARFRGEERDTAGDGFFATFDGPARAIRAGQAIAKERRRAGPRRPRSVFTSASASCTTASRRGSRSASARASLRSRGPARCSSPAPSATSSRDRGSSSTTAASTNSKGCRDPGTSTRRAPPEAAQPGSARTSASVRRAWAANGGFVSQ